MANWLLVSAFIWLAGEALAQQRLAPQQVRLMDRDTGYHQHKPLEAKRNNNNNNKQLDRSLARQNSLKASVVVPINLYNETRDDVTVISGQQQFQTEIYKDQMDYINIVQFYMGTCPSCQGFAPYFKLFVKDIRKWRKLIKVHTVNCNDDKNTQLCRDYNPMIVVPLVRWYTFGTIMMDYKHLIPGAKGQLVDLSLYHFNNITEAGHDEFKERPLTVSHRDFIPEARRDLASLRRATIEFARRLLGYPNRRDLSDGTLRQLSIGWHLFPPLDHCNTLDEYFKIVTDLVEEQQRTMGCKSQYNSTRQVDLELIRLSPGIQLPEDHSHLIVVMQEHPDYTSLGSTIVLDWSDYMCSTRFKVTHSTNKSLFGRLSYLHQQLKANDSNRTTGPIGNGKHPDTIQLPALFHVQFNRSNPIGCNLLAHRGSLYPKVGTQTAATTTNELLSSIMAETYVRQRRRKRRSIDWNPNLYAEEEQMRYQFNKLISESVFVGRNDQSQGTKKDNNQGKPDLPDIELPGHNPVDDATTPAPVLLPNPSDDTDALLLTDYYKILYHMIEKDIWRRKYLDGYQLLSIVRLLENMKKFFPFEMRQVEQSRIYNYLGVIQGWLVDIIANSINQGAPISAHRANMSRYIISGGSAQDGDYLEFLDKLNASNIQLDSGDLERQLKAIQEARNISLSNAGTFDWKYCSGSTKLYRGYTCGLWLLFHTMLVHEHQLYASTGNQDDVPADNDEPVAPNWSNTQRSLCQTQAPEQDLMLMSSRDRFVDDSSVLASIINYVRYFFNCDNCAGHFSCMVKESLSNGRLNMTLPEGWTRATLSQHHNIWLWDAHNRVNLRTKGTHSEDPKHPKKAFPSYEACPQCYASKPQGPLKGINATDLASLFNLEDDGASIMAYLTGRYQKESIDHNSINIEAGLVNQHGQQSPTLRGSVVDIMSSLDRGPSSLDSTSDATKSHQGVYVSVPPDPSSKSRAFGINNDNLLVLDGIPSGARATTGDLKWGPVSLALFSGLISLLIARSDHPHR